MDPFQNSTASLLVVPPGQNNEVITISAAPADPTHSLFSAGCSSTQSVSVWVKPCDNIPAAPTGLSYPISGTGIMTLSWNAVTTNTDGSPATYTPTGGLAGDRIVSYEVWYSFSDTDPNTSLAGWTKVWPTSGYSTSTSVSIKMPSNVTFYFGVRAIDTCGNGIFSKFNAIWLR